jgi:flagellar motor switch protein FliN
MAGEIQTTQSLIGGLAGQLAAAIGAQLGVTGSAAEVPAHPPAEWVVRATVAGAHTGRLAIGLSDADALALAGRLGAAADPPDQGIVGQLLLDACNQAFAALAQTDAGRGSWFSVSSPQRSGAPGEGDTVAAFEFSLGPDLAPKIVVWGRVSLAAAAGVGRPPAAAHVPGPTMSAADPMDAGHYPNLDVILDIDLPLSVRFGETEMTLDALTKLGPGSVIDLGRSPDDPVDVLVNGRMVARGEVVVVGGSYGVRISEVVSAADRLRSMGA